jgi:hypothetical protein
LEKESPTSEEEIVIKLVSGRGPLSQHCGGSTYFYYAPVEPVEVEML